MGSWLLPAQESSVAPGCFGDSVRKLDINRSGRAMFRKGGGGGLWRGARGPAHRECSEEECLGRVRRAPHNWREACLCGTLLRCVVRQIF